MSKVKYYYDSETLSYRKIERKKRTTLKYVFVFLSAAALFGFFFVFIASQYFESPKEKSLARELQNMQLQYEFLNKKMDEAEVVLSNIEERDNSIYRLYFEANPIPDEQRRAGFGGINRYKKFEGFDNSQLIAESSKRLDILEKAIRPYLAQVAQANLSKKLVAREHAFIYFVQDLEGIGDLLTKEIANTAGKMEDKGKTFSPEDLAELQQYHEQCSFRGRARELKYH